MIRFALVGAIGFAIDGGLLWLLVSGGHNAYLARCVSFPPAVVMTWWLNRNWTFSHGAQRGPGRQLNRYFLLQIIGALANFLVYSAILGLVGLSPRNALAALVLGAVAGLIINFIGSKRFVFSAFAPENRGK